MQTLVDKIEIYRKAIEELAKNPNLIPLMRQAQIAGWNVSLANNMPEAVADTWNKYLPKNLKVNRDSFEDKGQAPDFLTDEEMEEIAKLRGIGTHHTQDKYDSMWKWKFIKPEQSHIQTQRFARERSKRLKQQQVDEYGYGGKNYQGD